MLTNQSGCETKLRPGDRCTFNQHTRRLCFVRGVEKLGFTWSAGTHKYSTGEYRLDQLMNAKKSGRDAAKIHELLCLLGLFFDLDVFQVQSEEPNCLTYEFGKFGG